MANLGLMEKLSIGANSKIVLLVMDGLGGLPIVYKTARGMLRGHFASDVVAQALARPNAASAGSAERNWKRKGGALANIDLWQALDQALQRHTVSWHWVRGHAGHALNEEADRLARKAIPR